MAISNSTVVSQVFGPRATEIFQKVSGGTRHEGEGRVAVDAGFGEGPHGMPSLINPTGHDNLVKVREQQRRLQATQDAYQAADEVNSGKSKQAFVPDQAVQMRKQRLNRESQMHQQAAATRNWAQR